MAQTYCTSLRYEEQDPMVECAYCYRPILAADAPAPVRAYAAPQGDALYCSLYCALEAYQTAVTEADDPDTVSPVAFRRVVVARAGDAGYTVTELPADDAAASVKSALRAALADLHRLTTHFCADYGRNQARAQAHWTQGYYTGLADGRTRAVEDLDWFLRVAGLGDCLPEGFGKEEA
ncbi:MAG: hypothetical protein K6U87_09810 [Firmicutes bacterium]|nr:hypothetical protein [Bacillota bacterium]